jgi:hypothetical protein
VESKQDCHSALELEEETSTDSWFDGDEDGSTEKSIEGTFLADSGWLDDEETLLINAELFFAVFTGSLAHCNNVGEVRKFWCFDGKRRGHRCRTRWRQS